MRKIKYIQNIRLCRLYGFKPRNPISFFFWKWFSKESKEQT